MLQLVQYRDSWHPPFSRRQITLTIDTTESCVHCGASITNLASRLLVRVLTIADETVHSVNDTTWLHNRMLGRRHDARILTDRSRWDAAAFLYFGERQNMSQRRTYSNRRKRSKNRKGVSTLFGNILVELIGFATLLIVLFFVNTTPVDSQSAQVISDRSTVSGQASNDFRAYVSELFGMPVPFAN